MTESKRYISIDILRGTAIAIMIMGNMTPDFQNGIQQLTHAGWEGIHLADLAFPSFVFIMGTAAAFSRRLSRGDYHQKPQHWLLPVLRRGCLLFLLGLLCNNLGNIAALLVLPDFPLADFYTAAIEQGRLWGVLQRLGICYIVGCLSIRYLSATKQLAAAIISLLSISSLGYHLYAPEAPFAEAGNISAYIDSIFIGTAHNYLQAPYDPEGLYGSLNATATFLLGYLTGRTLKQSPNPSRVLIPSGIICLLAAFAWGQLEITSKPLWTAPYVLYTAGIAILCLAAIESLARGKSPLLHLLQPCSSLGKNPILIYLFSETITAFLWTIPYQAQPLYTYLWQQTCYLDYNIPLSCGIYAFSWLILLTGLCHYLAKHHITIRV